MSIVAIGKHKIPFIRCTNSCEILHQKFYIGWEYPLQHLFRYKNEILAQRINFSSFDVITDNGVITLLKYLKQTKYKNLK